MIRYFNTKDNNDNIEYIEIYADILLSLEQIVIKLDNVGDQKRLILEGNRDKEYRDIDEKVLERISVNRKYGKFKWEVMLPPNFD